MYQTSYDTTVQNPKNQQEEDDEDEEEEATAATTTTAAAATTATAASGSIRIVLVFVKEEKEVQNQYCMNWILYFKSINDIKLM